MRARNVLFLLTSATLLLGALPIVAAHGASAHGEAHTVVTGPEDETAPVKELPEHTLPNYFRHADFWSWQLAHTITMVLAWTIFMPIAIFIGEARSRYQLPSQALFHMVNGVGLFTGFVYNHSTPDLYRGNAHHTLGWVLTSIAIAWTLMSMIGACRKDSSARQAGEAPEQVLQHAHLHRWGSGHDNQRDSHDSGQGTERNSASLMGSRQNSSEHIFQKPETIEDPDLDEGQEAEKQDLLRNSKIDRYISRKVNRLLGRRVLLAVRGGKVVFEKVLLPLGFATLLSGFIVAGGLFRDRQIFSGLAHYIKGGIFFWYGLLTLGRWMGAFTEFGWAWNIRPPPPIVASWKSKVPSAEFTESFVIWLYGATNVFLEHLNNWGDEWTPSDLEHLSITILFFGGGLLGMLIESSWVQELLNTTARVQKSVDMRSRVATHVPGMYMAHDRGELEWEERQTYRVALNPMPALTIMLLGMMMSGHHQQSMVSTMMHAQWGALFSAFAIARAVTYITMYIKPPISHYPSRPPSEIVAAFCLAGGGLMFMNSSADTVWAIESNGLDAMTIFTLTMGLTGLVLAWEIALFAMKGWAIRKECTAAGMALK